MEQNLVGYLLNALDPETQDQVAHYLHDNPEAQQRLELLRQCLEPLAVDRAAGEPPAGLAERTILRVAERWGTQLPKSPATPAARLLSFPRPSWRRADLLVAACLLILIGGLAFPIVYHWHFLHQRALCQDKLRTIFVGLSKYSDENGQRFPSVAAIALPPRNVSGLVVPMLIKAGYLDQDFQAQCPGNTTAPLNMAFDQLLTLAEDEFQQKAAQISPCYGYSLGYKKRNGSYRGLERNMDAEHADSAIPVMADAPPANPLSGNSGNHGGKGQNVLFLDGHMEFRKDRLAGVNGDDIYVNRRRQVRAGLDWSDSVIACCTAQP